MVPSTHSALEFLDGNWVAPLDQRPAPEDCVADMSPEALGWDPNPILNRMIYKTVVFREPYPGVIIVTPPKHSETF